MPKYISFSKETLPITYSGGNNTTTVNSKLKSINMIEADDGVILYDKPILLSYDTNTKIQYDVAIDGVSVQTYSGGKMGIVGGVSNIIGWNTNSASITGAFNVSGAVNFTNGSLTCKNSVISQNNSPNATGTRNLTLGDYNIWSLTTGTNNIGIGQTTLGQLTTGSFNVGIGYEAGMGVLGIENICIGRNSGIDSGTYNASTCIGKNARITASNQVVLGASVDTVSIIGKIEVSGITTLSNNLNVTGNSVLTGNTSIGKNILFTTVAPTTNSIQMNQNPIYMGLNNDASHYIKSDVTSVSAGLGPNGVGIAGWTGVRLGSTQSGTSNILWAYGANGISTNEVGVNGKFSVLGNTTLVGSLICNQIYETTIATTGTTTPFTCNMALGSTFYIPTDYTFASNFQIIITNVPTDTTKSYTVSVIYRQPSTLFYISTARVSDTATTYLLGTSSTFASPLFNGGLPVLANTPNLIIQSFSIISTATSTNTFSRYITSSVNNHY